MEILLSVCALLMAANIGFLAFLCRKVSKTGAAEKQPPPKDETERENFKSMDEGFDNIMTYSVEVAKQSRKGQEDFRWR